MSAVLPLRMHLVFHHSSSLARPLRFGRHLCRNHVTSTKSDARSRFERVNSRLPRFLQRYTSGLSKAPFSHVTAFLLLHEITALVPLLTLAGFFHYTHWLPPYISEWKWAAEGMEKFGRYARRKGWLRPEERQEVDDVERGGEWTSKREEVYGWGEDGARLLVEVATAWAITKALLPLRLVLSVWATPWFATFIMAPIARTSTRVWRSIGGSSRAVVAQDASKVAAKTSAGAGTNAVGGGVASTTKMGR